MEDELVIVFLLLFTLISSLTICCLDFKKRSDEKKTYLSRNILGLKFQLSRRKMSKDTKGHQNQGKRKADAISDNKGTSHVGNQASSSKKPASKECARHAKPHSILSCRESTFPSLTLPESS
jgi:hypothetical protein